MLLLPLSDVDCFRLEETILPLLGDAGADDAEGVIGQWILDFKCDVGHWIAIIIIGIVVVVVREFFLQQQRLRR